MFLRGLLRNTQHCFKPYKGVSSNIVVSMVAFASATVSNPIREYLQMLNDLTSFLYAWSFKPYKGVSSNKKSFFLPKIPLFSFKPYKGVSSNLQHW